MTDQTAQTPPRPAILHRNKTVSYFSATRNVWVAHARTVSFEDLAAMAFFERSKVAQHIGLYKFETIPAAH